MADDSTEAASPTISVPSSAAEPITVERDGVGVGLTIMGSTVKKKSKSAPFNADTVIYPRTETGASTAVTVAPRADDTMIETYTIIHEASAPEEYRFRVALQPGERLVATGENSAVVDADGIATTTIDAPWAVDAVGRPVPFSLSVKGAEIVMTVFRISDRRGPGGPMALRDMRFPGGVIGAAGKYCGKIPIPPLVTACGALATASAVVAIKASICASNNQCLRVRVPGGILAMYCDGGRYCQN